MSVRSLSPPLLLSWTVLSSASIWAAPALATGIVRDEPLTMPSYAAADSLLQREIRRDGTPATYDRARTDRLVAWRRVTYRSDGLDVVAFVARPAGERLPTIVFCRGSYVQNGQAAALLERFHRLARAGFLVVAPQYRGSEGGQGTDEMGGADVGDVLEALRLTSALGGDSARVFLYGESRGGMMAFQALRDGAPVRAAATVGAFTDLDSLFANDPRSAAFAPRIWPDWKSRAAAIAERRSAVRWPQDLRRPVLILHGREDSLSPRHSLALAAALDRLGMPYELHVVDGARHTLGERAAWRDSTVMQWFRAHSVGE